MTAHAQLYTGQTSLLRRAIQVDALISGVSGLTLLVAAGPLSPLLGIPSFVLLVCGPVFILYAAMLWYIATRPAISRTMAWTPIILNLLTALICTEVLIFGWLPLTSLGWWVVLISGLLVTDFAIAQYLGLRRMR